MHQIGLVGTARAVSDQPAAEGDEGVRHPRLEVGPRPERVEQLAHGWGRSAVQPGESSLHERAAVDVAAGGTLDLSRHLPAQERVHLTDGGRVREGHDDPVRAECHQIEGGCVVRAGDVGDDDVSVQLPDLLQEVQLLPRAGGLGGMEAVGRDEKQVLHRGRCQGLSPGPRHVPAAVTGAPYRT